MAVLLFAFSSIIYNYYLGENAPSVLTGNESAILSFKFALMAIVVLGAAAPGATSIIFLSNPLLRLLPLVNLLALMRLFPVLRRVPCDFDDRRKAGVSRPVFDPGKFPNLNLDLTAWTKTDR